MVLEPAASVSPDESLIEIDFQLQVRPTDPEFILVGEEIKLFLYTLITYGWNPGNKIDKRQIKREKHHLLAYVMHIYIEEKLC